MKENSRSQESEKYHERRGNRSIINDAFLGTSLIHLHSETKVISKADDMIVNFVLVAN